MIIEFERGQLGNNFFVCEILLCSFTLRSTKIDRKIATLCPVAALWILFFGLNEFLFISRNYAAKIDKWLEK